MPRGTPWLLALGILAASCVVPSGCTTGVVFTRTVLPLDVNLDRTDVHQVSARNSSKRLQYRGIRVEWGDSAIGEIAREHGIHSVRYADAETLSVLGIWTQRWVRIYGE